MKEEKNSEFTIATLSISFVSNDITHGISSREQKHFDFFALLLIIYFLCTEYEECCWKLFVTANYETFPKKQQWA